MASQTDQLSLSDVVTQLKLANQNMSQLIQAVNNVLPRTIGTFTLAAAATTTVAQPAVKANSYVVPFALNAAAATLMGGTKSLYQSAVVAGTSFTVATADGTNAAGTEKFGYFLLNPA
ncbi:MAG: hypothetical protein KGL39_06385 [Patescibacteria group bacterium]|nr:hypothetical protein [Patescibacteria group bacterium]